MGLEDLLVDDLKELSRMAGGWKYKSDKCEHLPIKEMTKAGVCGITIRCKDCGSWYWLADPEIIRKLQEVQEFKVSE